MKSATFNAVVFLALLLAGFQSTVYATGPVVVTLTGGPSSATGFSSFSGFVNGLTGGANGIAQFNTPCGIVVDTTGDYIFVADRNNNAVRKLAVGSDGLFDDGDTYTFASASAPVGVAVDVADNVYVLNYGNGLNGSVYEYNLSGAVLATNALNLAHVGGIALDTGNNIYVTVNSNQLVRITGTNITTIATIPVAGTMLQGVVYKKMGTTAGLVAVADSGRNGIYLVNPANGLVITNSGFNGAGDFPVGGSDSTPNASAQFNQPVGLAEAGDGSLLVADYGNNRVKVVSISGVTTNYYGVSSYFWNSTYDAYPGWADGTVIVPDAVGDVEARQPFGVAVAPNGVIYATEDYYDIIRQVTGGGFPLPPPSVSAAPTGLTASVSNNQVMLTWTASYGATSYNVQRSTNSSGPYTFIANTTGTNYTDSTVFNGTTYYYVLSSVSPSGTSANSSQVIATIPSLAPPSNLVAVTTNNQVVLTWTASYGATSYTVERATASGGPYTVLASTSATNYADAAIVIGSTYYYVVQAVGPGGTSANSSQVSSAPPAPAAPANLVATVTNSQVVLTWAASLGAVSYSVERSTTNGGPYAVLANTSATNYADTSVFNGNIYYYVVVALNASGANSTNSAQVSSGVIPPFFSTPSGIAVDDSGGNVAIADHANNAIRMLNVASSQTTTFLYASNGISSPASVLYDPVGNIYVLNQNAGPNGNIIEFDPYGNTISTNATGLNQPTAFTMDANGNIFVTEQSSNICIVYPSHATNILISLTNANVSLQGIALLDNGNIEVSDAGNQVIWNVNPITKTYSILTGQLGLGGTTLGSNNVARLFQPHQLARAGGNLLVVADSGNNRIVTVNSVGSITNVLNSTNASIWFGQTGDPVTGGSSRFVPMVSPIGVAVSPAGSYSGTVFASETTYNDIRGISGALAAPDPVPTVPLAYYKNPYGIGLNYESTVLYVADPTNNTISALNFANNQTTVFLNSSNGLANPVDLVVDSSDNLFVLNQGTGGNGAILKFDKYGNFLGTNAAGLVMPTAITLGSFGNIYVTETNAVQVFNAGISNTLATITNANVRLQGIAALQNGSILVADAGDDVIWSITPPSTNAVLFTGAVGVPGSTFGAATFARLNAPMRLAQTSTGQLLIVDSGNNRIVVCDQSGTVSGALNANSATLWYGLSIDPVSTSSPYFVSISSPVGIAVSSGGTVYDSEGVYKDVRGILSTGFLPGLLPPAAPVNLAAAASYGQVVLAWSASTGASSYDVERSTTPGGPYSIIATNVSTATYSDTTVLNGTTYYYVVFALNAGGASANSSPVSAAVPALSAPAGVTATPASTQIALTWIPSTGATSYDVERATVSGGPYTIIATNTTGTNYTDANLANGVTYYYVLASANSGGVSTNSLQVSATVPVLAAPTGLTAVPTNGQVSLTWVASVGALSYNVARSTNNGGPYTIIASTTNTDYADALVLPGTTYYYVVTAANAGGLSINSSQASATLPPFFGNPSGIAVDTSGANLAIADHANNAIRFLNVPSSQTSTFLYASNGISAPASVLYDTNDNLYVLNQNAGPNGNIIEFDPYGNTISTNATGLNQPTAFTMDADGNIFVTEQSSNICVVFPSGATNILIGITNANVSLQGIALFDDGSIAVSDAGNHVIWTVNPITKVVTLLTGKLGVSGSTLGSSNFAKLYQPHQLARAGGNALVVADTGNNRLVTVTRSGSITNVLNSTNASVWFGQAGDPATSGSSRFVQMVSPIGVAVSTAGTYSGSVFASETYYNDIRSLNGNVGVPNPVPIVTLPYFNNPSGIAYDPAGGVAGPALFIADTANNAIEELDLADNITSTFLSSSDGITNPASVLLDTNENVYVLDQNSGGNGSIQIFDIFGNFYGTLVTGLDNPTAFAMDGNGTIFVAQQSGGIAIVYPSGATNALITITNANVSLQGIALFDNGNIAVSDAGNQVIWVVNPITKTYSRLTGQLGVSGSTLGSSSFARLNQPHQLARAGGNLVAVADYGNNRLVYVNSAGYVTNSLNPNNALVWFGQNGDPVANTSSKFIPMRSPSGVAIGSGGEVFASETYYEDVRGLLSTVLTYPASSSSVPLSYYSAPAGIALNFEGTVLYVADPANNTVSVLNLANNQTTLFLNSGNGLTNPVDVAVDSSDNLYVLNQGGGGNGSILKFDKYGNFLGTNAAALALPTSMVLGSLGNIYVTETNALQTFNSGVSNTLATITNANVRLQGVALLQNGSILVSDAGDDVIWSITPPSTNAVLFTGAVGITNTTFGAATFARLNTPMHLAVTSGDQLLIVDSGNQRIVVCDGSGTVSTALNSSSGVTLWFGLGLDPVSTSSPYYQSMSSPLGIAIGGNGTVYDSEEIYKDVRGIPNTGYTPQITPPAPPLNLVAATSYGQVTLSWSASAGAASYNIARAPSSGGPYTVIATNISATTYSDTTVISGTTYYYVVTAVNSGGASANSSQVSATAPVPPPAAPLIGWYDYEGNTQTGFYTVLHPVGSLANPYITYNDLLLAINPVTNGVSTYYIAGAAPLSGVPGVTNGSTPPFYADGKSYVTPLTVTTVPNLEIEAVNVGPGGTSAVTTAAFVFQVGGPTITGNNGANFTVSDVTSNVYYYYTLDGSVPSDGVSVATNYLFLTTNGMSITTNSFSSASAGYSTNGPNYQLVVTNNYSITTNYFPLATTGLAVASVTNGLTSIGPVTNSPATLSLNVSQSNVTFTVVAFRNGYLPSSPATQVFTPGAFVPNTISFGFASGEASSDFVASPGQTFVAPVTLSPLPSTTIYSMQFNLTVTNLGSAPPLSPGAYNFQSYLEKPDPANPGTYIKIPPLMFAGYSLNPPPTNQVVYYVGTDNNLYPFVNLEVTNSSLNLLGVGWLERIDLKTPLLYNTAAQTLITYSQAHDYQYLSSGGQVEVGGYSFQVPVTATPGNAYQIQIGLPSATDDGIGGPGSAVFIYAPTNGSLGGGSLNSIKNVTIGQRKYLVGDVYPFRWFNAGDFGKTNLENTDVEQVFEAAIYGINTPPAGSDFFDAMDSCGGTYVDLGHGYLEFNSNISGAGALNPLFDGNDSSINQIAFGDGVLDVCDVYVTFRRSLDPSLTLFQRFWTNGVRVAQVFARTNLVSLGQLAKTSASSPAPVSITNTPAVNFASTDYVATAGQVLQIPVTATVFGNYPLRVAMLNISIVPMDGSPSLTVPVTFTPGALGAPTSGFTTSDGTNNYAAAWLDSTIAGISNSSAVVGMLTVTVPTNATSLSSYAIHFDHASGSPNGIASFPKQALTGLITLSSRTNSTYNDGIPDSWRLRWFGTVNNLLSVSNANPTGDGIPNWKKFVAGVDPNTANDFPKLTPETAPAAGYSSAIYWPTVSGIQYVIQRSASLFPGSWTTIATNTGTGTEMEYDDNAAGKAKYYRVLILP